MLNSLNRLFSPLVSSVLHTIIISESMAKSDRNRGFRASLVDGLAT